MTHHAVPSQEVWDDFSVNVVQKPSWTLVVVSSVNKELLTSVLVNQRADLQTSSPIMNLINHVFMHED